MASKDIMLFFGHTGITAGIFYLASKIRRAGKIDYRIVIIGALLPDIIDKPLGLMILSYGNGRIIAHTLLFALVLTAIALYMRWNHRFHLCRRTNCSSCKKNMKLYALSGGTWLHLILDSMWLFPVTLLWPLFGDFQQNNYTIYMIPSSLNQPYILSGEIIGVALLAYLAIRSKMYKKTNLMKFIRTGEIG